MEPLSALSVACNILNIVEVAVNTSKSIYELYTSSSGFSSDSQSVVRDTELLKTTVDQLRQGGSQLATSQASSPTIGSAVARCDNVIQLIQQILDDCKVQKAKSLKATGKAWYKLKFKHKSNLRDLSSELQSASANLEISLAVVTRDEILKIRALLDTADRTQAELSRKLIDISSTLSQADVTQASLATKLDAVSVTLGNVERGKASVATQLHKIVEQGPDILRAIKEAISISEDSLKAMNHAAILRGLGSRIDQRFEDVKDPEAETFEWILRGLSVLQDNSKEFYTRGPFYGSFYDPDRQEREERTKASADLVKWLGRGTGVFHILGKPGCGKSTLMKYLVTASRTRDLLHKWAANDGKQLILSKFFFWKIGTSNQKTMRGLMRRILIDVIDQCPAVASLLFPEYWHPEKYRRREFILSSNLEVSDTDVKTAFQELLGSSSILSQYKLCLAIDGLDEFEEPRESVWSFCKQLDSWVKQFSSDGQVSRHESVKLLVSSREEPPILSAFSSAHRLRLHEYTKPDIRALVEGRLASNPHYQSFRVDGKESLKPHHFEELITKNAEGVFLWVVLLLQWIEDDLASGTSFEALQNIVETAPRELDEFFSRMLDGIPKHQLQGACFIFAMMLRLHGHTIAHDFRIDHIDHGSVPQDFLSTFGLSYIFDALEIAMPRGMKMNLKFSVGICDSCEIFRARENTASVKLKSWCKGLVDVTEDFGSSRRPGHASKTERAIFTHRSVAEFLSKKIRDEATMLTLEDDMITEALLTTFLGEARVQCMENSSFELLLRPLSPPDRLKMLLEYISASCPVLNPRFLDLLDDIDGARDSQQQYLQTRYKDRMPSEVPSLHWRTGGWILTSASVRWEEGGWLPRLSMGPETSLVVIAASLLNPLTQYIERKTRSSYFNTTITLQLSMLCIIFAGADGESNQPISRGKAYRSVAPFFKDIFTSGRLLQAIYPRQLQRGTGNITLQMWAEDLSTKLHSYHLNLRRSPWRDILCVYLQHIGFSEKDNIYMQIWKDLETWFGLGVDLPSDVLLGVGDSLHFVVGFNYPEGLASVYVDSGGGFENCSSNRRNYLENLRKTTLSSIIRWHDPPNATTLLEYTDPRSTLTSQTQEWEPPSEDSHIADKQTCVDGTTPHPWRSLSNYIKDWRHTCWIHGLYWRDDINEWWHRGFTMVDDSEEEASFGHDDNSELGGRPVTEDDIWSAKELAFVPGQEREEESVTNEST